MNPQEFGDALKQLGMNDLSDEDIAAAFNPNPNPNPNPTPNPDPNPNPNQVEIGFGEVEA